MQESTELFSQFNMQHLIASLHGNVPLQTRWEQSTKANFKALKLPSEHLMMFCHPLIFHQYTGATWQSAG